MRTIQLKTQPAWSALQSEFPKERDGVIYVRQSSLAQFRNHIHSYELQTDQFVEHLRNTVGCTGHIEIIADDEALSGTLAIQARPGMTRMMKLIESGKIGWIATVAVNRLTRDKWLVTPSILMKACHDYNVWIYTLRMQFNFREPSFLRLFLLEAEESARHLEWMKLVLGGALRVASNKGYYDGRWVVPGYLVDRTDPLRKKYRIYQPHAERVQWLFLRFLQLDGDFPALCKEVQQMPYLFPRFESWVDTSKLKFSLDRSLNGQKVCKTIDGHYKPKKHGILSLLTNPVYIGWWIPLDGGVIEQNHEAIIEEALFTYAHRRLSTYDLNGERQKPARVIRHGNVEALLKKVLQDEARQKIYPSPDKGGQYRCFTYDSYTSHYRFTLPVSFIDTLFLEKFFEHLQTTWEPYSQDWIQRLQHHRASQQQQEQCFMQQISEAQKQWQETMDILDDPAIPKTQQMKIAYARKVAGLEAHIEQWQALLHASRSQDAGEASFTDLHQLILAIIKYWSAFSFEKKMRFVNALVRVVILNRLSPGWFRMEIEWKRPDWEKNACWFHWTANRAAWKPEEDAIVQSRYSNETAENLMKALPDKTWSAIEHRAARLHVKKILPAHCQGLGFRSSREMRHLCWLDLQFARMHGLPLGAKGAFWFH